MLNKLFTRQLQVKIIMRSSESHNNMAAAVHHNAVKLLTLLLLTTASMAWMPDVRPDLQSKQDKIIARFIGNSTDYFKILEHDDENILVGARDVIYNISLNGLHELNRLEWYSTDADRELCALKGKLEADCHNYIRVFARLPDVTGDILVCGTNSYKPRCRNYSPVVNNTSSASDNIPAPSYTPMQYEVIRDVEALGMCPYSPMHNSTYAYAGGQLYSATVADFSGSDPLIYRENLRTEQYDLKQLNQPDFVGAIERKEYVLFFFREIAMEYMNYGKAIYSRVARVCKNDRGGPYTLSKSWTSFLKARLNCSVPGEFPFYFDEIQAVSSIVENGNNSFIYAVFTTSVNAIPGSAICAFNMEDIMDAFEGRFKSQKDSQSPWLPMQDEQVPKQRPGQCIDDSRTLTSIVVNFAKNHPLMETTVAAVYDRPLLTKVNLHHRLTSIAIDPHVRALNGKHYDVVYTGTDDGKITKFINIPTATSGVNFEKLRTVLISEMQVLPLGMPIRELVISSKTNTLLVVSDGNLVTVPLHHCTNIADCIGCLSIQDPNCAWDQRNHECKSLSMEANNKFGTKAYLQSLNTTKKAAAALCPKMNGEASSVGNDLQSVQLPQTEEELLLNKKYHYAKVGASTPPEVPASTSGVLSDNAGVSVVGKGADGNELDVGTGLDGDFLLNSFGENKITLQSVDPEDLMHSLSDPQHSIAVTSKNEQKLGMVSVVVVALCSLVFVLGLSVGMYLSKRMCKTSALNASHRNQFNSNSQFGIKHGKDINLLMNPNHYCSPQKKPNLDLEKDRSHECKNSTENLEKDLSCKTSTLTKVKRTYI